MYREYFGLNDLPFSIAPDPRYLYMSERHREALAHLMYGLNSDGAFILLTGDVGTGKTTVSRCLLEQIPDNINLALVLNPKLSALELLETICDELHIPYPHDNHSIKTCVDRINHYLLDAHARGRKTVVLIEEAQNLDSQVLEQLRLLTNLETNERKLLQVILLGQPELLDILAQPALSQLSQRITARYHLTPLNEAELMAYITYRLSVAGARQNLFGRGVLKQLYRLSSGVPRLVNVMCDRALLGTYVLNQQQVTRKILDKAASEVLGDKSARAAKKGHALMPWLSSFVLMLLLVATGWFYLQSPVGPEQPAIVTAPDVAKEAVEPQMEASESLAGLQWPDETSRLRSNSLAFQSLFQSWQLKYNPSQSGSPCYFAQTQGLDCMQGQANLSKLRGLNRPAVLELHDDENKPYFASLLALDGHRAVLSMAGKPQTISIDELQQHWYGWFTLLWQRPPAYENAIHPGEQGEAVVWLSKKMNQIDVHTRLPERQSYQPELIEKVRQFQLAQGLVADGIVGVQTLIHINNAAGHSAPVLFGDKS